MKRVTDILIWTGAFAVLFGLLSFANIMHDKEVCRNEQINVIDATENQFVNKEDIKILVHNKYGAIKGQQLKLVDTQSIEARVQSSPYIKNTEVYKTVGGNVAIRVEQRKPIVRVITNDGSSFYIDEDKTIMPLSKKYTAHILLVNGNLSLEEANGSIGAKRKIITGSKLDDINQLASFICGNKFFKAQIEQVYINENKEYELVPKVGRHIILFGGIKDLETKFEKLELFYKKGLKQVGWDKYKLVNLRYENQIVCTKK